MKCTIQSRSGFSPLKSLPVLAAFSLFSSAAFADQPPVKNTKTLAQVKLWQTSLLKEINNCNAMLDEIARAGGKELSAFIIEQQRELEASLEAGDRCDEGSSTRQLSAVRLHHNNPATGNMINIHQGIMDLYMAPDSSMRIDLEKNTDIMAINYDNGAESAGKIILDIDLNEHMPDILLNQFQGNDEYPLMIINDEISTDMSLSDVDKDSIKSISILNGEGAVEQYGAQGENGVINIITE